LLQKLSQSLAMPHIVKLTLGDFFANPLVSLKIPQRLPVFRTPQLPPLLYDRSSPSSTTVA